MSESIYGWKSSHNGYWMKTMMWGHSLHNIKPTGQKKLAKLSQSNYDQKSWHHGWAMKKMMSSHF